MPNIIVQPGRADPTLSQVLTKDQYNIILKAAAEARSKACCYGFLVSGLTLFIAFPLIKNCYLSSENKMQASSLNNTLFNGQTVMVVVGGFLCVNTDLLQPQQQGNVIIVQQMQPVYAQPGMMAPGQPAMVQQPAQPVYASAPEQPVYQASYVQPASAEPVKNEF